MLILEEKLELEELTEKLLRITADLKALERRAPDTLLEISITLAAIAQQTPKELPELNRLFNLCLRRLLGLDPQTSAKASIAAVITALDTAILALRLDDASKRRLLLGLATEQLL